MKNNEWITNRPPTDEDAGPGGIVWTTYNGEVVPWSYDGVAEGTPWMPVIVPEPYVKPKRYVVQEFDGLEGVEYEVYSMNHSTCVAGAIKTREAAEEIAAIYERVMP